MKSRIYCGIVCFCMVGMWPLVGPAQVLLNSGFENGSGADADDWLELTGPSGSVTRSDEMPRTGSFAAHMTFDHINNPPAGAAYFIEQNLGANTIDSTQNYSLEFWAKVESTNFEGTNMFFQILWLDQDGSHGGGVHGEILMSLIDLGINTNYQQFGFTDVDVPDTADSFLLRFQVAAGAVKGVANGMFVDDVDLASAKKILLGDVNCDGAINLLDVDPFIEAIANGTLVEKADINQDGSVNLLDVGPFIALLGGN